MPSVVTRFKGIRSDSPVEDGFVRLNNVDMYTNEFRQRNPTQSVDSNGNTATVDARISVAGGKVFVDIEGAIDTEVVEAVNTSDTGTVNLGPWTTVATGMGPGARYTDSQFGALRTDGIENIVITGGVKYGCGVPGPTVSAKAAEPPGAPPIQWDGRGTNFATGPVRAGIWGGQAIALGGTVKATATFVKQEGGVDIEGPNGPVLEFSVSNNDSIGVDGPGVFLEELPDNYTEIRVYRTVVGGDIFYRCTTVDIDGDPILIWDNLEFAYLDDTDAALISNATFSPTPAPAIQTVSVNTNSSQRTPSVITVFYTYVKVYPGGGAVESAPSGPGEIYSMPDAPFVVSHTASIDAQVSLIRIYRSAYGVQVVSGKPTYYRAAQVANATANTELTLTDDEIIAQGDVLLFDNDKPPAVVDTVLAADQIWYLGATGGDEHFFYVSPPGRHESVDLLDFIAFNQSSDPIVGGLEIFGNVLIFKGHETAAYTSIERSYISVSTTIGCVDRNTISVAPAGAIWLSYSGVYVWSGMGRPPQNVSYGRVFQTLIQPYIQEGSKYSGVYYPDRSQYLLNIRASGTDIVLCYWFETGEWTTYSFSEHPLNLAAIDTPEGERWLYVRNLAGTLNVYQGDVPPTDAVSLSDSITTISTNSATAGAAYDNGDVFFINNSGTYRIPRSGASYLSEVDISQPNVTRITQVNSSAISAIYSDSTSGEMYIRNYTTAWFSPVNLSDVRTEDMFFVGAGGTAFFSHAIVDPTISPVLIYDPNAVYSTGDIVFNPFYQGVRRFLGYTQITVDTRVTNGSTVHQAWPWPAILDTGTPPNADNALYLYDQTSTLSDLSQVHFEGEFQGVGTSLLPSTTYEVHLVSGDIYTVHLLSSGAQVAVGGNHYYHDTVVTSYAEDELGWPEQRIVWLPIATPFTFGTTTTVNVENWETLSIDDYMVPTIRTFNGTTISDAATFSVGDSILPAALAQAEGSEPSETALYFTLFERATSRRILYRMVDSVVTVHMIVYSGNGEYNYGEIAPTRVTDEEVDLFDGSTIRTFRADYNFRFSRSIDGGNTLPILGKGSLYWRIITDTDRKLWFGNFYTWADITAIPDLTLLSNNTDHEIILLHESGEGGPSTVYWVSRNQLRLLSEISTVSENYYNDGTLNVYGIIVTIESCPIKLGRGHRLKRVKGAHFLSRAHNPAVGILTVTPGASVLDDYHQSEEDPLGAVIEGRDLWFNKGLQEFDTETTDDSHANKEIKVHMDPEGGLVRWTLVCGDMFLDTGASIKLYPPTFDIEVEESEIAYGE